MPTANLNAALIDNWDGFHSVVATVFGFPAFYGRNMNAFIDCLTYLDEGDGMSSFALGPAERLEIVIVGFQVLLARLPEIAVALIEAIAALNLRYIDRGKPASIVLVLA